MWRLYVNNFYKWSFPSIKINFYWLAIAASLCSLSLNAKNYPVNIASVKISGQVTDEGNGPMPGVNVLVKGTADGTTTDVDGRFTLSVDNAGAVLVFSFIGYETTEVAVGTQSVINVSLHPDITSLNEVVVVGYGTQKKTSLVGAVSSVSSKDLVQLPVPNVEQAIQGRVPGVVVTNNGSPGSTPIVRIRGINSINYATNPTYVVDGIIDVGNFSAFDSKDIESVEVLKDASSAAIYGSRASAGVVLITTKKGSYNSGLHVNVDSYMGYQKAWKKLDLLNTDQYVQYGTSLLTNAGQALPATFGNLNSPIYAGSTQTYAQTNTNWQDEIFRTASIAQTHVSVSGGSEKSKFNSSIGYFNQDGIMLGTGYKRFNARMNSEHKITKGITFGQTLFVANGNQLSEQNSGGRSQIMHTIRMTPYITVKNPNNIGGYNGPTGADGTDPANPVRTALQQVDHTNTFRILATAYLDAKIFKWLTYRFNVGIDASSARRYQYSPVYSEGFNGSNNATLSDQRTNYFSPIYTNLLTFDKSFGKHTINAIGGIEYQTKKSSSLTGAGTTTSKTERELIGLSSLSVVGNRQDFAIYSYIGRLNYDYAGKYLVSASIRRDGTSNFAPGYKFGNFPSVGLGWRISEENFMKSVSSVSELKLRASYGTIGNLNVGGAAGYYPYQSIVSSNSDALLGGSAQIGAFVNQLGNKVLQWELTNMSNIGLDLGLLQNKVTFSAEYYKRTTNDLILSVPAAASAGYTNNTNINIGKMENSGFEFQGGFRESKKALRWGIDANIGFVKNKVTALESPKASIEAGSNADFGGFNITRTEAGHAAQSFYGWKTDGLFQNAGEVSSSAQPKAAPGDIRFVDKDKDGSITSADRMYLGSFLPKFTYGFNLTASYKNFDFVAFFQGVNGNKVYNGTKVLDQGMLRLFNASTDVLRAWTPTNTNTDVPRAVSGDPNGNTRTSNRFIESGSYLRLKNLSIGYNLPEAFLKDMTKNALTKFRVYVNTSNLLTFTKYTGYDPEVGARFNTALTQGIDYGQFPQAKTITFGLQVGF